MTFYPKEVVELFPLAGVSGADTTAIKTKQMQKAAELKTPLTHLEIKNIVRQHHEFLSTGGAGGRWQTLLLSGMVTGIYIGAESTSGSQAVLRSYTFLQYWTYKKSIYLLLIFAVFIVNIKTLAKRI